MARTFMTFKRRLWQDMYYHKTRILLQEMDCDRMCISQLITWYFSCISCTFDLL